MTTPASVSSYRVVARKIDVMGVVLGIVYAIPSFGYPFGRDQGAFDYIGRGLLRGELPYVASVDTKPPAIFIVYALAALLPGDGQIGVRIVELLCIAAAAFAIFRIVRGRATFGVAFFALSGVHYTCFDYWNSAQSELWEATAALAAYAVGISSMQRHVRAFAVGALLSVSCLFKLPAVVLGVTVSAIVLFRAFRAGGLRSALQAAALVFLGGLAVALVAVSPYIATGTTSVVYDVLLRFNEHYSHHTAIKEPAGPLHYWAHLGLPFWPAILALGAVVVRRSRYRRRAVEIASLFVASLLTIVWQGKWFHYHYAVLTPFLSGGIVLAAMSLTRRRLPHAFGAVALLVLAGLLFGPSTPAGALPYREHVSNVVRHWTGRLPHDAYFSSFRGNFGYSYLASEYIAAAVREASAPGDTLCVDAFEPALYGLSGMRCTSRFFATHLLRDSHLDTYRGGAWKDEYEAAMLNAGPTLFLGRDERPFTRKLAEGPYRSVGQVAGLRILRRQAPP